MPGKLEGNSIWFRARRLFTNRLLSGFQELSAHFLLAGSGTGSIQRIGWEIESTDGNSVIRSKSRDLTAEEQRQGAVLIAATLPPSWDNGRLKVLVDSGDGVVEYQNSIERFKQAGGFILPLSGSVLTAAGHRIGEAHRSAYQIPSQQFGWDFLGLSEENLGIFQGGLAGLPVASDFAGFGMAVIAPADGQVMEAKDRMDDLEKIGQHPQELSYFQEDLTRALGNYVLVRHTEEVWSVLAHLQRDSVIVNVGQNVSAGEALGALGNSGYSSGPHLHYHLMDGPNIMEASPLPVMLTLEDGTFAPEAGNIVANG